MELVYAGLLLHAAKKDISEENVAAIVKAAGLHEDAARIKALVASLKAVNIDEAIKQAAMPVAVAGPAASAEAKPAEKKEDEGKKAEEAAAGLSSLFG